MNVMNVMNRKGRGVHHVHHVYHAIPTFVRVLAVATVAASFSMHPAGSSIPKVNGSFPEGLRKGNSHLFLSLVANASQGGSGSAFCGECRGTCLNGLLLAGHVGVMS